MRTELVYFRFSDICIFRNLYRALPLLLGALTKHFEHNRSFQINIASILDLIILSFMVVRGAEVNRGYAHVERVPSGPFCSQNSSPHTHSEYKPREVARPSRHFHSF